MKESRRFNGGGREHHGAGPLQGIPQDQGKSDGRPAILLEVCTVVLVMAVLTTIKMIQVMHGLGISGWLYWPTILAAYVSGLMTVAILYTDWRK